MDGFAPTIDVEQVALVVTLSSGGNPAKTWQHEFALPNVAIFRDANGLHVRKPYNVRWEAVPMAWLDRPEKLPPQEWTASIRVMHADETLLTETTYQPIRFPLAASDKVKSTMKWPVSRKAPLRGLELRFRGKTRNASVNLAMFELFSAPTEADLPPYFAQLYRDALAIWLTERRERLLCSPLSYYTTRHAQEEVDELEKKLTHARERLSKARDDYINNEKARKRKIDELDVLLQEAKRPRIE